VRSRKDTVTGFKKISLIDNFSLGTSYDLAKDSLRWAPFVMSGRTRLFKNIDISYASYWDFYILDSTGKKNLNQFEWAVNRRPFRMENTSWNFTLSYALNSSKIKSKTDQIPTTLATENEMNDLELGREGYVDFNIPWTLNFSYSFRYVATNNYPNYQLDVSSDIVQTFNFFGDLNLTPRWKIGVRSGWDFTSNELSYTAIDIYRDLHCWEMRFSWIPKGYQQSWNFSINAKASLLQDLKLNKKKDFRDY
jgi:hypothetical protein